MTSFCPVDCVVVLLSSCDGRYVIVVSNSKVVERGVPTRINFLPKCLSKQVCEAPIYSQRVVVSFGALVEFNASHQT